VVLVEAKWLAENGSFFTEGQRHIFIDVCAERNSLMGTKGNTLVGTEWGGFLKTTVNQSLSEVRFNNLQIL
jgi:hypothetical protein